ncbi:protein kinase [uncultured Amnibacterium sp.]|uniref:serine/threonine-protein kinase n=1 Tax=uncultured Amnibacterium sp. TaxID=1631851 RepID=UPI0035C9EAAD
MPEALDVARFNARQSRYRLDGPIGRGGMSTVYRGTDLALDRQVAVKVFTASAAGTEELRAQQREARLVASFAHHSLVRLYDVGVDLQDDATPRIFLVMELIDGTDLRVRLREGALPLLHVAHLGYDLAEGLAYLHAGGVMHRDVKPANVLLMRTAEGRRPRVKLTDFGIARSADQPPEAPDDTTGTAAYLSPEQAEGAEVGTPGDVYALGLVVLEAVTGRTEFPGGILESAFARLDRDPVLPRGLPDEWALLLRRMTARRPADRPTAAEAAEAFRRLLVDEVEVDDPVAAVGRLAAVRRYNVLAPGDDPELEQLCLLVTRLLGVDVALVAVADEERTLVRARWGEPLGARVGVVEGELEEAAVLLPDVAAAGSKPPLARGDGIGCYASAPLCTHDGSAIGVVAVLGRRPRRLTDAETATLRDVADMAMHEIELRRAVRRLLVPRRSLARPA